MAAILVICMIGLSTFRTIIGVDVLPEEPVREFCTGCSISDTKCECTLTIEHRLTMLHTVDRRNSLLKPREGQLVYANNTPATGVENVITADGVNSRLVIAINGRFPGPRIMAYEGQEISVTVVNKMHTDSVTIHFHGIHQRGTPWMDGVAFVTQCPILPGQTFVYRFTASPTGTLFYHAHIGDQRSMGLYGPLIIRRKDPPYEIDELVLILQDWNHDMDAETAYNRMITDQFDLATLQPIKTTYSFDRGNFSRFVFHSGLVNGKGRYYFDFTNHNGAPLERFKIKAANTYRFRVIAATTLYPLRIFIEGHPLKLLASDGYEIEPKTVRSIVIQPGERYDFEWTSPGPTQISRREIMFVAVSLETDESLRAAGLGYHGAEAVLELDDSRFTPNPNPVNENQEDCTSQVECLVFNCPFLYYPPSTYRRCLKFDDVNNNYPAKDTESVMGTPYETLFFNFAFPPDPSNLASTEGSVNGKSFASPTVSMLTQTGGRTSCETAACRRSGVCQCTHTASILRDRLIQMVFLNLGSGRGWSHPVHLHGHSFFVMKMGYARYDNMTGEFLAENDDIVCDRSANLALCVNAQWRNPAWTAGNIPGLNDDPPQKDTIIVPTGGYVVVRFVSDNPGMWFLHCHIDLHNTNGMGMVIIEGGDKHPAPPEGFPTCGDFQNDGRSRINMRTDLVGAAEPFHSPPVGIHLVLLVAAYLLA